MSKRAVGVLLAWLAAGSAGCGGAPRPEPEPASPPPALDTAPSGRPVPPAGRPLTELDALEHDLSTSEYVLDQQLQQVAYHPGPPDEGPAPPAATSPVTPAPTPGPPEPRQPAVVAQAGSPCDLACRALASMRRAADGICRITAAGSARCERARSRVRRAEERVRTAGCVCFDPQP